MTLPRWLLLRDVPFSSYPPPKVILCHSISNGHTWMGTRSCHLARGGTLLNWPIIFFQTSLARWRHRIGSPIFSGVLIQCTVLVIIIIIIIIIWWQNLLENTNDKELTKKNVALMVQWHIDRQVSVLKSRSNEDPEFIADLEYLETALEAKLEDLR